MHTASFIRIGLTLAEEELNAMVSKRAHTTEPMNLEYVRAWLHVCRNKVTDVPVIESEYAGSAQISTSSAISNLQKELYQTKPGELAKLAELIAHLSELLELQGELETLDIEY